MSINKFVTYLIRFNAEGLLNIRQVRNRLRISSFLQQPVQISGIALGEGLDDRGFESRQWRGIFLFTTVSRPALGPTQPPIQWVPGAPSLGVTWQGREPDHSPPSSAQVKNAWSYISTPPIRLMTWYSVKCSHNF
jgi:hypothetical protein